MIIRLLLPLLLAISCIGVAEARMYRWVDENGTTVYSQSPPPSGKAAEIKVHVAPPAPPKSDATRTPNADEAKPEADSPSKEEIAASNKIKSENCTAARYNLNLYTNLGKKLVKTPDGLYKRLTEEERQQKIKDSQNQIKEFCDK
ncbi:DUF4124 domain-containing protein [Sedimenticola sp.]|uniref:DUF4124 domain-containing protein n=1 Tax=Sedimenticola sp. TaxID=1940285 RepID=UPI003D0E36A7